jgi:hypothetical protein
VIQRKKYDFLTCTINDDYSVRIDIPDEWYKEFNKKKEGEWKCLRTFFIKELVRRLEPLDSVMVGKAPTR